MGSLKKQENLPTPPLIIFNFHTLLPLISRKFSVSLNFQNFLYPPICIFPEIFHTIFFKLKMVIFTYVEVGVGIS